MAVKACWGEDPASNVGRRTSVDDPEHGIKAALAAKPGADDDLSYGKLRLVEESFNVLMEQPTQVVTRSNRSARLSTLSESSAPTAAFTRLYGRPPSALRRQPTSADAARHR
jgi:hypothetical protein